MNSCRSPKFRWTECGWLEHFKITKQMTCVCRTGAAAPSTHRKAQCYVNKRKFMVSHSFLILWCSVEIIIHKSRPMCWNRLVRRNVFSKQPHGNHSFYQIPHLLQLFLGPQKNIIFILSPSRIFLMPVVVNTKLPRFYCRSNSYNNYGIFGRNYG